MAGTSNGNRWWVSLSGATLVIVITGVFYVNTELSQLRTMVDSLEADLAEVKQDAELVEGKQDEVQVNLSSVKEIAKFAARDRFTGNEAKQLTRHVGRLTVRIERLEAACAKANIKLD